MARCRSCGAEVTFVPTRAGKLMPLDPHPAEDGNVRLDRTVWADPAAVVLAGDELTEVRDRAEEPLYRPHFATCPNADRHRRRRTPPRDELPANVVPLDRRSRRG